MNEKLNKISKAAFIRLHPEKSPEEIVGLAAKAGVSIVASYVHNTRSNDRVMVGMSKHVKRIRSKHVKRISKKSTIVSYTQPQPDKNRSRRAKSFPPAWRRRSSTGG